MKGKSASTSLPTRQARIAKPAKTTTPLHGGLSHSYGESQAKSVVAKLHK